MRGIRKKRFVSILLMVMVLALAVAALLYALQQNINLFYSPSQIQQGEAPVNARIRAGGMVVAGSVQRDPESLQVSFTVTDFQQQLRIHYQGILPDLFREGQGIVAQGILTASGELEAEQVLAKHDENYMPPEVSDALQAAQQP